MFTFTCLAVQHERKPMLDKKEAAAAAAAVTNGSGGSGSAGGGSSSSSGNNNNSSNNAGSSSSTTNTPNANIIIGQPTSLYGQHQQNRNKSFWRDEFASSSQISATNDNHPSSSLSNLYSGNSAVPNLNMFPVGFNLAEITSSLARGSKTRKHFINL